jgi:hypothetical protein
LEFVIDSITHFLAHLLLMMIHEGALGMGMYWNPVRDHSGKL